jgi:hypothetical protein
LLGRDHLAGFHNIQKLWRFDVNPDPSPGAAGVQCLHGSKRRVALTLWKVAEMHRLPAAGDLLIKELVCLDYSA